MNYEEARNYISNTEKFGRNYGLSRTEKILEFLGNPHKSLKCIHIAGTNGKGSTTAMLNSILIEAGYKVGMYTSPFLEVFEERIQINSENISEDSLCVVVSAVRDAVEKVIGLGMEHPTEFEIITCAAFLYFFIEKVDYAVIEVGLGGRLDSTNVIDPILSIITSISFDHMQVLGDTLEKIAAEKAGIIKSNVPVILYPQNAEVDKVIVEVCKNKCSRLIKVGVEASKLRFIDTENFFQKLEINTYKNRYNLDLALLGSHQILNCATVVNSVEMLRELGIRIEDSNIYTALKKVKWIGRLEILHKSPLILIDGAHNIDAINRLVESIGKYFKYDKLILVLGILADKQVEDMLKKIVPLASRVVAVTPHSERAELAENLKDSIVKYGVNCEAYESYEVAYKKALGYCGESDLLLFSGSLHMIGDMRKIIKAQV